VTLPVTVRRARSDELDAAGAIVADAYLTLPGMNAEGQAGEDGGHGYLDRVRDARARARVCEVLVAVDDDGVLLGCVTYVPAHDNPYADLQLPGEAGFRMLGVAPGARGRGAGRALVEACVARARDAGRRGIALATGPDMLAAHRLYERLGFRRAVERDFEPVSGIRLLAYVLDL